MKKIYHCNVCGYIYQDNEPPHECPFCRNRGVFDQIKINKIDFAFLKKAWQKQVAWMNSTKYQIEIQLNPDDKVLQGLAETMIKSLQEGKQAYCPCRILTGNQLADLKIVCPCYFYMGEVEIWGRCHCSLYVTKKWLDENK